MLVVHPQYFVDENQQRKAVVLAVDEWEHIVEEREELDSIRTYDEAKTGPQEVIPFEQAVREIRGK